MSRISQLKEWYETYEQRISTWSLATGFFIDALTLQQIDALRENLWMGLNMLIIAVSIIVLNRGKVGKKEHFWFTNILQFSFGAVLGSFFIFYFRSTTLVATWPFLLVLLLAIVANEFFQKRYARLTLQLSFFYLAIFSLNIFLVPLILHRIGPFTFILSGLLSLLTIFAFVRILERITKQELKRSLWYAIGGIFIGINILYFTNLIPPIPLSLKDAGIYYFISRDSYGNFVLGREERSFLKFFHLRERIHWPQGNNLFAYSAIYSPGSLNTTIIHEWQYKDEKSGEWVTTTRVPLRLSGGRIEGFRTYSSKSTLSAGPWRVNVSTPRGQLIGRINFLVIPANSEPPLDTVVK